MVTDPRIFCNSSEYQVMQISRSRHATASSTQPKTILPAVISMALLGGVSSAQAAPVTIGNPLVVGSFKDLAATTYVSEISFGVAAIGAELSTWSILPIPARWGET